MSKITPYMGGGEIICGGSPLYKENKLAKQKKVRAGYLPNPFYEDYGEFRGSQLYDARGIIGGVVVGYYVPQNLVAKMEDISQAFVDYRHSKLLKRPLTTNYIIIFLLITLVIIFSATWFGFRLAKELTVPLMELAEGTRRGASGHPDFRLGW